MEDNMTSSRIGRVLFGAVAALLLFAALPARAADHRDAPTIDDYSAIDINDVYIFRNPSDQTRLVVALSTQAVADPLFGSSYHFQPNALYRLNFTTRKDAHPTESIDFVFGPFGNGPDCPAPAPACQTYEARFPGGIIINGFATQGTSGPTHLQPNINDAVTKAGLIRIFAGPREDPFFFDLVGFNRAIAAGDASLFTGVDAFKGKSINAIVVEFPLKLVFPPNACTGTGTPLPVLATPCGVWAVTYLGDFRYDDPEKFEKHPEQLRQVDRMGNPAVNTALIPAAFKDAFNFGEPKDDPKDFAQIILNQILTLDKKFGTCSGPPTSAASCNPNNVPVLAALAVPDILRFASNQPDGYPNGRQPQDRSTDLLIKLILNLSSFTDGTNVKTYCTQFPFLGPPLQLGSGSNPTLTPQSCP
jgi:hypothetical protein